MDPLSVSMAIIGLLGAAQKTSSILGPLISRSKNAPQEMRDLKSTVDTIRSVLSNLQLMLLGHIKADRNRTSLILVEQIVVTLSACVATFSELDVFVETLGTDDQPGLIDRLRWATKASAIKDCLQELEKHKSSLILMMTILTCESNLQAETAVNELSVMVKAVLESHQLIAERLLSIEIGSRTDAQFLALASDEAPNLEPISVQRNLGGFAFEEVLQSSWVYKRSLARSDDEAFSSSSSAGRTASWSMLSGLSLADNISNIAVQALPIYAQDINNNEMYQFGDIGESQTASGSAREPYNDTNPTPVFGVSLWRSLQYANVAISLVNAEGKSYIYGYIPIVVAKNANFIKVQGTRSPNIFSEAGSALRIHDLETAFRSPPSFGKGVSYEGYTVYDAAHVMLRYLKLLTEPVIPYDLYDQFTSALDFHDGIIDDKIDDSIQIRATVQILHRIIAKMPPVNRQLLLYLLDLLAVLVVNSDRNLMTAQRLVAAFQPALLSRTQSLMTAEEYFRAAKTMVFMCYKQDHFLLRGSSTVDSVDEAL